MSTDSASPSSSAPRTPRAPTARVRHDGLTDVSGLGVGHYDRLGEGWLSGTTVVLAPEGGMTAAVDVRGGGPGTRETDALSPGNLVRRIDAVVLTGGSAYGLDAASGVMNRLEEVGRGFPAGLLPGEVVPVVPAACVFDLGRGGDWRARPDAGFGMRAFEAVSTGPVPEGCVGVGAGAVAGGMKGGVGTASTRLSDGTSVGALVVVNAAGSVSDPATGQLYGRHHLPGTPGRVPDRAVHRAARALLDEALAETGRRRGAPAQPPLNTTLAVVATDAALSRSQARKLAGLGHDGLARAIRPVHLLHDGDTVFALSTTGGGGNDAGPPARSAERAAAADMAFNQILAAGADVVTRAIVRAVLTATGVDGPGGLFPSYRDLYGADAALWDDVQRSAHA